MIEPGLIRIMEVDLVLLLTRQWRHATLSA